jgi:hypothetical protein
MTAGRHNQPINPSSDLSLNVFDRRWQGKSSQDTPLK